MTLRSYAAHHRNRHSSLFQCNCNGSEQCKKSKSNVGSCADEVLHATREDTVVSCTAAQWICAADPLCSTALEYYNRFCGAMFRGRRCTKRCLNSISILRRQRASAKLESCKCEGSEDFDCAVVKSNMDRLCFGKGEGDSNNEVEDGGRTKSAAVTAGIRRTILYLCMLLSAIFKGL